MASENTIYFYPGQGGHSHDGENSSFIDTSKYSLFDFSWGFLGDPYRVSSQTTNYNSFQNFIIETVNNAVLKPSGLILQPGTVNGDSDIISNSISTKLIAADAITANEIAANTITANEIAANTITANQIAAGAITASELAANIVLVNNYITSNNFNGTIAANGAVTNAGTVGWAVTSYGHAVFDTTFIRGSLIASSVSTPGVDIDSAGNLTANNFSLYANGAIYTSSGNFQVDASGNLYAENGTIRGEISSDTFVTHNRFGVNTNYTRPTVLIDNTNDELSLNSTNGGLRIGANFMQRYTSGSSFLNLNWDFVNQYYYFAGTVSTETVDTFDLTSSGTIDSNQITLSGTITAGSSYMYDGAIYSSNILRAAGAALAPYFIMSGTIAGTGSSLIRRSDGYILINSSKRELKTNIGDISDSLVKIAALRPRVFNWKSQPDDPDDIFHREIKANHRTMGFVVEEVAETFPEYLEYRIAEDGTLDGHYWKPHDFIALAMQGIKDLSAKVTSLEQRIAQLEG